MTERTSLRKRASFEGSLRPSRQVPWDRSARKPKPGGRPTPGEAELPQAWPREVRATPAAPATRGLRRVLGLFRRVSAPFRRVLDLFRGYLLGRRGLDERPHLTGVLT